MAKIVVWGLLDKEWIEPLMNTTLKHKDVVLGVCPSASGLSGNVLMVGYSEIETLRIIIKTSKEPITLIFNLWPFLLTHQWVSFDGLFEGCEKVFIFSPLHRVLDEDFLRKYGLFHLLKKTKSFFQKFEQIQKSLFNQVKNITFIQHPPTR